MKCADCKFANKSGNQDYVFCTYWQNEADKQPMTAQQFAESILCQDPLLTEVAIGWGYPNQHYQAPTHWSIKGTASESIMWKDQICVYKNQQCLNYSALNKE